MLKKILIFGALLALMATPVLAQETEKKELTPRQLLLLQIPDDFTIELNGISWGVTHESGEPLEAIIVATLPEITIYLTLGTDLKAFMALVVLSPEVIARVGYTEFNEENPAPEEVAQTVTDVLEAFKILTDDQLAEFVKKNISSKKSI